MKSREVTAVAIRVVIVYLILKLIITIPTAFAALNHTKIFIPLAIVITLASVALAGTLISLWWGLSKQLIDEQNSTPSDDMVFNMTPQKLEKIILRCMGVYLIITNLRPLANDILTVHQTGYEGITTQGSINIIIDIVIMLVGLFLMIRPRKWLMIIRRIRN